MKPKPESCLADLQNGGLRNRRAKWSTARENRSWLSRPNSVPCNWYESHMNAVNSSAVWTLMQSFNWMMHCDEQLKHAHLLGSHMWRFAIMDNFSIYTTAHAKYCINLLLKRFCLSTHIGASLGPRVFFSCFFPMVVYSQPQIFWHERHETRRSRLLDGSTYIVSKLSGRLPLYLS